MNYTITLTEKQLITVQNALEEYERLRLGQTFEFASDLCEQGVDLTGNNPNREKAFDLYIERRNAFKAVLETLIRDVAFFWRQHKRRQDTRNACCRGYVAHNKTFFVGTRR